MEYDLYTEKTRLLRSLYISKRNELIKLYESDRIGIDEFCKRFKEEVHPKKEDIRVLLSILDKKTSE